MLLCVIMENCGIPLRVPLSSKTSIELFHSFTKTKELNLASQIDGFSKPKEFQKIKLLTKTQLDP